MFRGVNRMAEQHNVSKEQEQMDRLYKWILDTKYKDFPAELVSYAKMLMLDVLGCIIGGSKEEAIPEIVNFVQEHGGAKESYLPIYGGQYSAAMVGFALGSMARSLDFGDVHMQGSHTSEYVFPTLLAATGLKNKVTGLDLLNAFIIGNEVLIRMGIASNWKTAIINKVYRGGHFIFGVIAAVAKLLDLNQKELNNAMGMAIGKIQPHHTPLILKHPSHMVRLHHGFIAQDAINICLLAKKGLTGPGNVILGEDGFLDRFPQSMRNPDALTKELGRTWHLLETSMKPYPACKCTHTAIEVLLSLIQEHKFYAQDIASIHVKESSFNYSIVCVPEDKVYQPSTKPESQFSLPYVLSITALNQSVWLDSYTPELRNQQDVKDMMNKITFEKDDNLPDIAAVVTVKLNNGNEYTKEIIYPKGDRINNPISRRELLEKFHRLLSNSAYSISNDVAKSIINSIDNIEKVIDVEKEIILPLVP